MQFSSIKVEFFKARLAWKLSNNSLGVGGTITLLDELELEELELVLVELEVEELAIDEVLEDSLLEVDEISLVLVITLDSLELYSLLLLKAGFEQAVSDISAMIGSIFFILSIFVDDVN